MQILIGCAINQIAKEAEVMSFNINTFPPGANVVVSHNGADKRQYLSPAAIEIYKGFGDIELSKDGYWDEDRLIIIGGKIRKEIDGSWESWVGSFTTGGLIGFMSNYPSQKIIFESDWSVNDETKLWIDGFSGNLINSNNYKSKIPINTIQVNFLPINPQLIPILAAIKDKSKYSFDEAIKIIKNMYDDGKINKEEFVRAQIKINQLYHGKYDNLDKWKVVK